MAKGCSHCKVVFAEDTTDQQMLDHVQSHPIIHDRNDPLMGVAPSIRENAEEEVA